MSHKPDVWLACRIKKQHTNYWSALQHCVSLQKVTPFGRIHMYQCNYCGGIHVTTGKRARQRNKTIKKLKRLIKHMGSIEFWYRTPPSHIENTILTEMNMLREMLGVPVTGQYMLEEIDYEYEATVSSGDN